MKRLTVALFQGLRSLFYLSTAPLLIGKYDDEMLFIVRRIENSLKCRLYHLKPFIVRWHDQDIVHFGWLREETCLGSSHKTKIFKMLCVSLCFFGFAIFTRIRLFRMLEIFQSLTPFHPTRLVKHLSATNHMITNAHHLNQSSENDHQQVGRGKNRINQR